MTPHKQSNQERENGCRPSTSAATGPSEDRLSEALELYLRYHNKQGDPTFESYARRTVKTLINTVGNKPVSEFTRADARAYVDHCIQGDKGKGAIKTTSTRRRCNTLKAIIGTYIRENDLVRSNPFVRLNIQKEGQDSSQRTPLKPFHLSFLIAECEDTDDELRWLILMLIDTGARLSEVVGLSIWDIYLDEPIPYISIVPHRWRTLKSKASKRELPLVGRALWAAERIKKTATPLQTHAFPRYNQAAKTNANSASAAIGQWLKKLDLDHSAHEFRHTLADRLRAVECPEDIRFAIGGWSTSAIGNTYGDGYPLEVKAKWLERIHYDPRGIHWTRKRV